MTGPIITGEILTKVRGLHVAGQSIRTISIITGYSRSSIHRALHRPDREQARPAERPSPVPEPQALPVPLARPRKAESEPGGVPSWLAGAHPLRPEEPGSHPADRDLPGWRRRRPGGPW